jgi:hypothetical protein
VRVAELTEGLGSQRGSFIGMLRGLGSVRNYDKSSAGRGMGGRLGRTRKESCSFRASVRLTTRHMPAWAAQVPLARLRFSVHSRDGDTARLER